MVLLVTHLGHRDGIEHPQSLACLVVLVSTRALKDLSGVSE